MGQHCTELQGRASHLPLLKIEDNSDEKLGLLCLSKQTLSFPNHHHHQFLDATVALLARS